MPSIRLDKQIFPFFDSVKTPVTAAGTSDSFHNNGYDTLVVEITGTAQGRIEGCMNIINSDGTVKSDDDCSWKVLGLINLKSYDVSESFTAAGHYCVGINGMARVRVVLTSVTGEVIVLGTAEA